MKPVSFNLPDGTPVSFDVPDDWTEDQVLGTVSDFITNMKSTTADIAASKRNHPGMEHTTSSKGPNYTPLAEKIRKMPFYDVAKIKAGEEFTAIAGFPRRAFNYLTDKDEYNQLKKEWDSTKEARNLMFDVRPGASLVGSAVPYVASSPSAIKAMASAPFKVAGKALPSAAKIVPNMPAIVSDTLAGRGLAQGIVNPLKAINAAMIRNTTYAPPQSIARATMDIMKKPAVQGTVGGATIGSIHPDADPITGAIQGGLMAGIGRLLTSPFRKSPTYLTRTQKEAVAAADKLKYYLEPGTRTGDPFKEKVDELLGMDAITAPQKSSIDLNNSARVNRLLGKYFGMVEDTPNMDAATLGNIKETLNNRIARYTTMSNPVLTKPLADELKALRAAEVRWEGGKSRGDIINQIDAILHMAKVKGKQKWGKLTPEDIQNKRTELNQIVKREYTAGQGTPRRAKVYDKINDILDKALVEGIGDLNLPGRKELQKKVFDELKNTRKLRAQFSIIQQAADKNSGVVDLPKVYRTMLGPEGAKNTNYRFLTEDNLIADLAKIGKLKHETKAKMDLGTRNTLGSFLREDRPVLNQAAFRALAGLNALPFAPVKKAIAGAYFNPSGWPAATGFIPLFSKESSEALTRSFIRGTYGAQGKDDTKTGLFGLF